MFRVGITGVPGSGKTTLARSLSSRLSNTFNTELISEYAREYISKHGTINYLWEQYRITNKQIEWEDSVKCEILVTDSPIHLGLLYASNFEIANDKDLMCYNDIFKLLNKHRSRYDIIFHLEPDIKPIADGIRAKKHLEDNWISESNMFIKTIFNCLFPSNSFVIVKEINLDKRVSFCLEKIKQLTYNINKE